MTKAGLIAVIRLVVIGAPLLTCGCASPYLVNRGRDASDIVSVSFGKGWGAKGRLSVFACGLLYDTPRIGIRGGQWFVSQATNQCTPLGYIERHVDPGDFLIGFRGEEKFSPSGVVRRRTRNSGVRRKEFRASSLIQGEGAIANIAFIVPPTCLVDLIPWPQTLYSDASYYYTEVEIVVGAYYTVRVGVNPGEFLDFLLGWVGADIMKDDIAHCRVIDDQENNSLAVPSSEREAP